MPNEEGNRPEPAAENLPEPLDVVREVYKENEFQFQDDGDEITLPLALDNVEVQVISRGSLNDVAHVMIHLPVRATPEFRALAGEFLHRLNFGMKRKYWEMDYEDGEIRASLYADTMDIGLTKSRFRAMLNALIITVDSTFPYLTSVLNGRMAPAFAADQAEAAIVAAWTQTETDGEED